MSKSPTRLAQALVAACALVLAAPLGAQTPADDPVQAAAAQSPDRERERRRVFHLADGSVLRAKARWQDGGWQLLRERRWEPLAPERVRFWRDERELLAEAERRSAELGSRDEQAQLEHAAWLQGAGLIPESLDLLERRLRTDPDHGPTRELLARHPRLAELPAPEAIQSDPGGALAQILSLANRVGPARQELILRELDQVYGGPNLERVLEHALRSGSDRRRAFATLALRRIHPGGALRELFRSAALDPAEDVRRGAAFALRDVGEEIVVLPLVRALESGNATVRTYAAESLGHMGFAVAAPALRAHLGRLTGTAQGAGGGHHGMSGSLRVTSQLAYVRDFDVEIAQAASIADPVVGLASEGVILDVRLGGLSTMPAWRELRSVRRALAQLDRLELPAADLRAE